MRMVHFTLGSGQRDGQGQSSQYGDRRQASLGLHPPVAPGGLTRPADLKTVKGMGEEKGEHPLPENESVEDPVVITLGGAGEGRPVREGGF